MVLTFFPPSHHQQTPQCYHNYHHHQHLPIAPINSRFVLRVLHSPPPSTRLSRPFWLSIFPTVSTGLFSKWTDWHVPEFLCFGTLDVLLVTPCLPVIDKAPFPPQVLIAGAFKHEMLVDGSLHGIPGTVAPDSILAVNLHLPTCLHVIPTAGVKIDQSDCLASTWYLTSHGLSHLVWPVRVHVRPSPPNSLFFFFFLCVFSSSTGISSSST